MSEQGRWPAAGHTQSRATPCTRCLWVYFSPMSIVQSRGPLCMPKQNLYFWIKMEWMMILLFLLL